MIRTAIGIGVLAIVCGIGVIVYRQMQSQSEATALQPSTTPIPPKQVTSPEVQPQPAPGNQAPAPAPTPIRDTTTPAPAPAPQPVPVPKQEDPQPPPTEQGPGAGLVTYKVKSGDSLWEISRKVYGSPNHTKLIADANNLNSGSILHIGQLLIIPELRTNKSTPADADHETSSVPQPIQEKHQDETQPMPPTLSRTAPSR